MERQWTLKLSVHVIADLVLPVPTPTTLQIEAAQVAGAQAVASPTLTVTPFTEAEPFLDFYRNPCRRLMMAAGDVRLEYAARVTLPDTPPPPAARAHEADALHLPTDALLYTLPSRYCQSDKMVAMAADLFGDATPGFARVQTICDWINGHITYQYGASDAGTSAYDTAAQRVGVCRDFAHLGVAFCRALNIPACYVSGYCLGLDPPDFHAYFQAWLDGHWVSFDATERQPRPALVQVAVGRDAADCAWCTFYGYGETKSLSVEVMEEITKGITEEIAGIAE
jgi:transglutaminase-like putative cysteine protease